MPTTVGFDPANANHLSPKVQVGGLFETVFNNRDTTFVYVQVVDIAVTDGDVVEWADVASGTVSQDRAGGTSLGRIPAGVAVGAITADYYGYIMVHGTHDNLLTDGGVSAADGLVPHASTDGAADTATTTTAALGQVFGQALADDTATRTQARIRLM